MRISLFFVCGYLIILFIQLAQKNDMQPGKLRKYEYQYEMKLVSRESLDPKFQENRGIL